MVVHKLCVHELQHPPREFMNAVLLNVCVSLSKLGVIAAKVSVVRGFAFMILFFSFSTLFF